MARINGNDKADVLSGTSLADTIYGYGGDDRIWGRDGDDSLLGHAGNDELYGERGNDKLWGGDGDDFLSGGSGNDVLHGERGNDTLNGGGGVDALYGGSGNDTLIMDIAGLVEGCDKLFDGGAGFDTLRVNADGATVKTEAGVVPATVSFFADVGEVAITDGVITTFVDVGAISSIERFEVSGNTALTFAGGNVNATVVGGSRDDVFLSGAGNETFIGGGGQDEFLFFGDWGDKDKIVGFNANEDVIVSTLWEDSSGEAIANRSITETGGHTIVTTTDFNGAVTHTMSIDAVGLPLDIFKDGYDWV